MSKCNLYTKGRIFYRFVDCDSSTNAGTSSGDLTPMKQVQEKLV